MGTPKRKTPLHEYVRDLFPACVFDLETTGLDGRFGRILCGVIKDARGAEFVFRADDPTYNPKWTTRRADDKAIAEAIAAKLSQYEIVCAHNGEWFDKKFLNTRLAQYGLPRFSPKVFVDPFQIARARLGLGRNSLDALIDLLGITTKKTHVDGSIWTAAAMDGDRKAMDYIVEHCIIDVRALWEVVEKIRADIPRLTSWGSYR